MVSELYIVGGVVLFIIALYATLRILDKRPVNKQYQKELQEILTNKKYKVKGKND